MGYCQFMIVAINVVNQWFNGVTRATARLDHTHEDAPTVRSEHFSITIAVDLKICPSYLRFHQTAAPSRAARVI
jgi:hypothetical protein